MAALESDARRYVLQSGKCRMRAEQLEHERSGPAEMAEFSRPCLACGYDLRGLGDEPRCPECGLLNVAERFRDQVRAKLDRWTFFYSNPFAPWKKRLPGWFWSLDRPGDLRRCVIFALIMLALAAGIAAAGGYAVYGVGIVRDFEHFRIPRGAGTVLRPVPAAEPVGPSIYPDDLPPSVRPDRIRFETHERFGVFGSEDYEEPTRKAYEQTQWLGPMRTTGTTLAWWPVKGWWILAVSAFCISVLAWALPAFVGVLTQVRRLMPGYKKPVRSTLAALLLEAHRLPIVVCYLLLIYAVALGVAYWQHVTLPPGLMGMPIMTPRFVSALTGLAMLAVLAASVGWIGVLRSDPTHQLIRNRKHAVRFFVMYCLMLLPLCYFTIFLAISILYRRS